MLRSELGYALQTVKHSHERQAVDLARCSHDVATSPSRQEHADMVAAIHEVARTCESLAHSGEQYVATVDGLTRESEESARMCLALEEASALQVLMLCCLTRLSCWTVVRLVATSGSMIAASREHHGNGCSRLRCMALLASCRCRLARASSDC
jgi:hypothetical protein